MNRFAKMALKVAAILLIPGVLLIAAGGAMGGMRKVSQALLGGYWDFDTNTSAAEVRIEDVKDVEEIDDIEDFSIHTKGNERASGEREHCGASSWANQPQTSYQGAAVPQGEIHSLDFEVGAAELILTQGDEFALEVEGSQHYRSWQEHGVWKIETQPEVYARRDQIPTFYVTIPEDAQFLEVEFSVGIGTVEAESITCGKASIEVGAGTVTLENLISEQCEMEVGAGAIDINGGKMSGITEIECGLGSVDMNVERPESYGCKMELGMGTISIDGAEYSGVVHEQRMGSMDAKTFYNIECAMGEVNISFAE